MKWGMGDSVVIFFIFICFLYVVDDSLKAMMTQRIQRPFSQRRAGQWVAHLMVQYRRARPSNTTPSRAAAKLALLSPHTDNRTEGELMHKNNTILAHILFDYKQRNRSKCVDNTGPTKQIAHLRNDFCFVVKWTYVGSNANVRSRNVV